MFHTADWEEIKAGRVTDVYFARTLEILEAKGIDKEVRAEFFAKKLPGGVPWAVFAGAEEVASLMEGKAVDIRALAEGEVFYAGEPVMEIEGRYRDICVFETAVLGLICQASGIATRAARMRIAAGDRMLVSFGARRMHPVVAPMIERAAYIGGCDGVAVTASARLLHMDPMGTIPHALVIMFGDTVEALKAFDEVVDGDVKRVALIDTYNDEKFEALRVAEALGDRLYAVRLDTPSSRRGDFRKIFEEVRWELDLRGYGRVKLFASGGLDEETVIGLRHVVDAFGVGTSISSAPVVDYSMDIVEVDGVPHSKRGKCSGAKRLVLCRACGRREVVPLASGAAPCPCGGPAGDLLTPLVRRGRIARELPSPQAIREAVIERLEGLELAGETP
ncbi:MAG TPA: nicotinate phosphoribosyltransferase [Deltaproteobacteria bacterium]|nr:nicotinate phosphoribosyltransferase [Deltaproteobacteria bacterium]